MLCWRQPLRCCHDYLAPRSGASFQGVEALAEVAFHVAGRANKRERLSPAVRNRTIPSAIAAAGDRDEVRKRISQQVRHATLEAGRVEMRVIQTGDDLRMERVLRDCGPAAPPHGAHPKALVSFASSMSSALPRSKPRLEIRSRVWRARLRSARVQCLSSTRQSSRSRGLPASTLSARRCPVRATGRDMPAMTSSSSAAATISFSTPDEAKRRSIRRPSCCKAYGSAPAATSRNPARRPEALCSSRAPRGLS